MPAIVPQHSCLRAAFARCSAGEETWNTSTRVSCGFFFSFLQQPTILRQSMLFLVMVKGAPRLHTIPQPLCDGASAEVRFRTAESCSGRAAASTSRGGAGKKNEVTIREGEGFGASSGEEEEEAW